jgi:hypothetical protein
MIEIHFTEEQRQRAIIEGHRRQHENEKKNRKGRNKGPEVGQRALEKHLIGAAGELAVAVYLDMEQFVFNDTNPIRGSCDLPGKIDVKTRPNHSWDLLVQLDDDLDKRYVLVTIKAKRIFIHGWIDGAKMRQEWIKEYVLARPCYCVPQSELNSIEDLKCQTVAASIDMIAGFHGKRMMQY